MKKPAFLLTLVAVLLMAVGVVAGCGGAEETTPSVAVDKAIQKTPSITSAHEDIDLSITGTGEQNFTLGITGGVDMDNSNPASPKMKGNISFTGLDQLFTALSQVGGEAGLDMSAISGQFASFLKEMQFVQVDNRAYLQMAGTWYDMGAAADLSSMFGLSGLMGGGTSTEAVDTQCFQNAMKDPAKVSSDKLFKNLSQVGSEKIDGVDTTHYKAEIDIDKLMATGIEIGRSCGQAEASGSLEGGQAQLSQFFKTTSVDLWIDDDSQARQVKFSAEIDPNAVSDVTAALGGTSDTSSGGLTSLKIEGSMKLSKIGETFDIQKPEGPISSISDLLGGLGGLGGLGDITGGSGSTGGIDLGGLGGTSTDSSGFGGTDIATPSL